MELKEMFRRHRMVILTLALFATLIAFYCSLSMILSGHLGLPFQKTVTLDRAAIYERLEDFELVGGSIRSTSEHGNINIDAAEGALQSRYLTLNVRHPSDPGITAYIE